MQVRVTSNITSENCHGVFQIVSGLKEMRQYMTAYNKIAHMKKADEKGIDA